MIELLTWISLISGGMLIILLLLSLLGGLDLDFDVDADVDTDTDTGNIGIVKGLLTFVSIGSWVVKLVLAVDQNPIVAFSGGIVAGLVAVFLLNAVLHFFLSNQANVNWSHSEALFQEGKVYLKVPAIEGEGIVQVKIKGALRELKAKTNEESDIPTGSLVIVEDIIDNIAIVTKK